ncbi:MAG TPA: ATP-grasp domain-containing protein [Candidatus Acidoferrales bacterium]|jgi:biotin carboxylase|nr:ATP-grasp domain-containing protein [Candidatus Acidoferrales bacterium]
MSRLLILASKLGYQTRSFAEAAKALGVGVVFASDRCHQLEDPWADGAIAVRFDEPEEAARRIVKHSLVRPVDGLIALGDRPTTTAAYTARALGFTYNSPQAVENCRSKLRQREVLRDAGLPVPGFFSFRLDKRVDKILPRVQFPCVVKPLRLAASQGVIRANQPEEFQSAVTRIKDLLESPAVKVTREPELDRLLVERYIPGAEVAVEGLLTRGKLRILAVFDKPDPLEGPYFEETLYVTPSRLPDEIYDRLLDSAERTAHALGLTHGPLHAEFRINDEGPWVLEAAPRPIGGLCSRALRFGPQRIFLEELLVRHALGMQGTDLDREDDAAGAMMIPVPRTGILEKVEGEEQARATPGIEDVRITARLHDFLAAWPDGATYLGFLFARGKSPDEVEAALRLAHSQLKFEIAERLPVQHPVAGSVQGAS